MDDQTQNNNDFSAGFLIKDKKGNIKKVQQNSIDDFSILTPEDEIKEDFVQNSSKSVNPSPVLATSSTPVNQITNNTNQKSEFNINPTPVVKNQATLLYDPDEEEEIRKHQVELNKILQEADNHPISNYEDLADKIILEHDLKFDSDILKKRFQKIVESFLRGIRNAIETEEVLHRQTKVGGLDFHEELSKQIVNKVNDFKKNENFIKSESKKDEEIKQEPELLNQTKLSSAPPSFIPMPKPKLTEIKDDKLNISEEKKAVPPEKIIIQKDEANEIPTIPVEKNIVIENQKSVDELYKKSPAEEMAKMASNRQQAQPRPQVIDIRRPSSIVGPVEELLNMNLKEFRRLGNNPAESADKILEKVYLLEEESWEMRMDGISAWQDSELYLLYIDIGRESLEKNKTVQEIIANRENSDLPNLHMQEFLAINDLNNKLII